MSDSDAFHFSDDPIALPKGAWARTERRTLRRGDRPVLSLTQGRLRACVYPLYTPQGFALTSECPADHPHHNSFWIAADHVNCLMPAAGGRFEEYTYNFYVDEVFQGRAPGRILAGGTAFATNEAGRCMLRQSLEWRGPIEWAAPEGRLALREERTYEIALAPDMYVIDVRSRPSAADWDVSIGPTRHAYFNVRVAEGMAVTSGGRVEDDRGRAGGDAISGIGAKWVDYSGPVGGGHWAGLSVFPHPGDHAETSWFVSDWGVVTVGPFRNQARPVRKGQSLTLRYRVLAHDGDLRQADVAERYEEYVSRLPD